MINKKASETKKKVLVFIVNKLASNDFFGLVEKKLHVKEYGLFKAKVFLFLLCFGVCVDVLIIVILSERKEEFACGGLQY